MRKLACENVSCKHHNSTDNRCSLTPSIGPSGYCTKFEKGFLYYINLVWNALGNKNFIDAVEMDEEMRIGLYYVMRLFHLGFTERVWGGIRMYSLSEGKDGPALKYEEIIKRKLDMNELEELLNDFNSGNLPKMKEAPAKTKEQPFGWLSPTAEFFEGDFAEHEEVAFNIITQKKFEDEYWDWKKTNPGRFARDFLAEVKGYCLIHNPMGGGDYMISRSKPFTKKQREFLYQYFMDMGDRLRAESFLDDKSDSIY